MEFCLDLKIHYLRSAEEIKELGQVVGHDVYFLGEGFYKVKLELKGDELDYDSDADFKYNVVSCHWLKPQHVFDLISHAMFVTQTAFKLFNEREEYLKDADLMIEIDNLKSARADMAKHQVAMGKLPSELFNHYPELQALKQTNLSLFEEARTISTIDEILAWLSKYNSYVNELNRLQGLLLSNRSELKTKETDKHARHAIKLTKNPYVIQDRRDAFETAWNRINEAHAAGRFTDFNYPELFKELDHNLKRSVRQQAAAKALRMWRVAYLKEFGNNIDSSPDSTSVIGILKHEIESNPHQTMRDLATKVGVSAARVSELLNHPNNVSLKQLRSIKPKSSSRKKNILGLTDDIKAWLAQHKAKRDDKSTFYDNMVAKYGYTRSYIGTIVKKLSN